MHKYIDSSINNTITLEAILVSKRTIYVYYISSAFCLCFAHFLHSHSFINFNLISQPGIYFAGV